MNQVWTPGIAVQNLHNFIFKHYGRNDFYLLCLKIDICLSDVIEDQISCQISDLITLRVKKDLENYENC